MRINSRIDAWEDVANARLIATAPKLLDLCKKSLASLRYCTVNASDAEAMDLLQQELEDVIREATGETKRAPKGAIE